MYNVCGIYKITSPNKKVYIGQSKNVHQRFIRYKRGDCKGQKKLYNSINKYGWINHTFEIVLECTEDKLNEMEIFYIELFQTFNTKYGLNLNGGGSNGILSDESKSKISNSLKGRPVSEETRAKIKASLTGKKHSDKTKIKMSKPRTEEHKANISAGKIGKKHNT